MNMPPLPYLKRIPGLSTETLEACYADPGVWDGFDPALTTLASPDPQAFRPPDQPKNVLQVGLPTNFKAARFDAEEPTALLRNLEADIEAARFDPGDGPIEIPVKLKVHDSIFVPLAKWPMLMAGNYRCIRRDDMIPIKEAVHANVDKSREIYDWVWKLCTGLGAEDADMVPFEKYAKAAEGLGKPSSAARALFGGAEHIERVDCLVRRIAAPARTPVRHAGRDRHTGGRAPGKEPRRPLNRFFGITSRRRRAAREPLMGFPNRRTPSWYRQSSA